MNSKYSLGGAKEDIRKVMTIVGAVLLFWFLSLALAQANSPGGGGGGIGEPPPPPREEVGGGEQGGGGNTDEPPPTGEEIVGGTPGGGGGIPDDVVADIVAPEVLAYMVAPTVFFANGAQGTVITAKLSEVTDVVLTIINDDDEQVFTDSWQGVEGFELFWKGLDENNRPLPDGDYALFLTLSDAVGNIATVELDTVTIVSVRGLISDAYHQLQSENDRSLRKVVIMLQSIQKDSYWHDTNTLSLRGARSVEARLVNALRFLDTTEFTDVAANLTVAREHISLTQ